MTDYRQIVRRLELDLYKAEHGMGMPYDRERVRELRQLLEQAKQDAEQLKQKYPEGIPAWMTERGMSPDEIDAMMQLRRKAFPKTAKVQS